VVSVFNITTCTKGTLDYVFCKEMFIKIAAVGTKSSMIYTRLTITFVVEQRYILPTSAKDFLFFIPSIVLIFYLFTFLLFHSLVALLKGTNGHFFSFSSPENVEKV